MSLVTLESWQPLITIEPGDYRCRMCGPNLKLSTQHARYSYILTSATELKNASTLIPTIIKRLIIIINTTKMEHEMQSFQNMNYTNIVIYFQFMYRIKRLFVTLTVVSRARLIDLQIGYSLVGRVDVSD